MKVVASQGWVQSNYSTNTNEKKKTEARLRYGILRSIEEMWDFLGMIKKKLCGIS